MLAIFLIPTALCFCLGKISGNLRQGIVILSAMTLLFLGMYWLTVSSELAGNPWLANQVSGLVSPDMSGNMEGKETRFGIVASSLFATITTAASCGAVNAMHDSFMPLSGMCAMLGMMTNAFYGGVGVGILNFFVFIIIAVFISGLMVGRTPEFLGKKIEAREMKIAVIVALLHPLLILAGTALATHLYANNPAGLASWLNNPGYHGFSEMLYEYTSSAANNGSGFEGLGDNTPWWNISTGVVLILSRYLPIIGPVAIAGLLARKKYVPESAGTLRTDTATFGIMVFFVIWIIAALAFFPALALGPLAEHFTLY